MTIKRFEALQQQSATLKKVAERFLPGSDEYVAVEHAAFALAFAITERFEEFSQFISNCKADLTDEQREHLRSIGLTITEEEH